MTVDDVIENLHAVEQRTRAPHAFDLAAALQRGRVRARRRRMAQAGGGLVAVTALAVGGLAVWPEAKQPNSHVASSETTPEHVLRLLSDPQKPSDELWAGQHDLDASVTGALVESTARALGETEMTKFWAGVNQEGEVCLLAHSGAPYDRTSMGCCEPSEFAENGLTVPAGPSPRWGDAWLLPDGYVLSPEQAADWNLVMPNLALPVDD